MPRCPAPAPTDVSQPPTGSLQQRRAPSLPAPDFSTAGLTGLFTLLWLLFVVWFCFLSSQGRQISPKASAACKRWGSSMAGIPLYGRGPRPPIFQWQASWCSVGFTAMAPGKSSPRLCSVSAFPSPSNSLLFITSASEDHLSSKFPRQILASEELKLNDCPDLQVWWSWEQGVNTRTINLGLKVWTYLWVLGDMGVMRKNQVTGGIPVRQPCPLYRRRQFSSLNKI